MMSFDMKKDERDNHPQSLLISTAIEQFPGFG